MLSQKINDVAAKASALAENQVAGAESIAFLTRTFMNEAVPLLRQRRNEVFDFAVNGATSLNFCSQVLKQSPEPESIGDRLQTLVQQGKSIARNLHDCRDLVARYRDDFLREEEGLKQLIYNIDVQKQAISAEVQSLQQNHQECERRIRETEIRFGEDDPFAAITKIFTRVEMELRTLIEERNIIEAKLQQQRDELRRRMDEAERLARWSHELRSLCGIVDGLVPEFQNLANVVDIVTDPVERAGNLIGIAERSSSALFLNTALSQIESLKNLTA